MECFFYEEHSYISAISPFGQWKLEEQKREFKTMERPERILNKQQGSTRIICTAKGFTVGEKLNLQLKGASQSALLSGGLFVDCQRGPLIPTCAR